MLPDILAIALGVAGGLWLFTSPGRVLAVLLTALLVLLLLGAGLALYRTSPWLTDGLLMAALVTIMIVGIATTPKR